MVERLIREYDTAQNWEVWTPKETADMSGEPGESSLRARRSGTALDNAQSTSSPQRPSPKKMLTISGGVLNGKTLGKLSAFAISPEHR